MLQAGEQAVGIQGGAACSTYISGTRSAAGSSPPLSRLLALPEQSAAGEATAPAGMGAGSRPMYTVGTGT